MCLYFFCYVFFEVICFFFFSSRRRHTRCLSDWSSDVCSSDLRADDPEHRVEDEERDHRLSMCRVRGAGRGERPHGAGLGNAFLEDLALLRFAVGQNVLRVDRLVELSMSSIDLELREQ